MSVYLGLIGSALRVFGYFSALLGLQFRSSIRVFGGIGNTCPPYSGVFALLIILLGI